MAGQRNWHSKGLRSASSGINDFHFLSAFFNNSKRKKILNIHIKQKYLFILHQRILGVSILPVHWKISRTSERAVDPKKLSNLPYPCIPVARRKKKKKKNVTYKGTSTRLSVDFSAEILQTRGEWNDIFTMLKMSIFSQEYFIWKIYLNIWKNKGFSGSWSHHFMTNRWGINGKSNRLYFLGLQNHCRWWLQPWD